MAAADQGLLAPAALTARDGLGAALHLATQSGSRTLGGAAKNAFVGGTTSAIWVAAALTVVDAMVGLLASPALEVAAA